MVKETYCTYHQSLLLKKKGFDWPCDRYYSSAIKRIIHKSDQSKNFNLGITQSAPSVDIVLRWFREEWGLIVTVQPSNIAEGAKSYTYKIYYLDEREVTESGEFSTFDLALMEAIDDVLKNYICGWM